MAKYEIVIKGQFDEVVNCLQEDIIGSAMSMNLVDQTDYHYEGLSIAVRVYDKYFMRNSSRASLNLTVVGHDDEIFITAIGAGGGNGLVFNFTWGTEEEMVAIVEKSVNRMINT